MWGFSIPFSLLTLHIPYCTITDINWIEMGSIFFYYSGWGQRVSMLNIRFFLFLVFGWIRIPYSWERKCYVHTCENFFFTIYTDWHLPWLFVYLDIKGWAQWGWNWKRNEKKKDFDFDRFQRKLGIINCRDV